MDGESKSGWDELHDYIKSEGLEAELGERFKYAARRAKYCNYGDLSTTTEKPGVQVFVSGVSSVSQATEPFTPKESAEDIEEPIASPATSEQTDGSSATLDQLSDNDSGVPGVEC